MTLKWVSSLVGAAALGAFATANSMGAVPIGVNLALAGAGVAAVVLMVVGELHERLDARLSALSDFLVNRLDELGGRLDETDARDSLAAYLTEPGSAAVVPLKTAYEPKRR